MKKIFVGVVIGLVVGSSVSWLALRHPAVESAGPAPAKNPERSRPAVAGLKFATPEVTQLAPEAPAYGRVLDPAPFLAALSEVDAAQAAATASNQEFQRVKKLHADGANASMQAVEAAEAARRRDQVQLAAAQARLLTAWGPALAGRTDRRGLARDLASGQAALVRVDLQPGDSPATAPTGVRVAPLADDTALQAVELLGPATTADPQAQGRGYLALWRGGPAPIGTVLRAMVTLPGDARPALVVPRSALVRHAGAVFVYVQKAGGACERRIVTLGTALDRGVVVTSGLAAGDQIVVTGAQQLMAAELLGDTGDEGDAGD
ncbi:MAG TPA: hypothetical protein VL200_00320 [Lacunisphaera sp.]|jgi:hypothetical protein|nr:hypothetical protein [Lacunisphaera sp.]